MSTIYICESCGKRANPPKGFSECECPNCGSITSESKARTEVPDVQPTREQDQ